MLKSLPCMLLLALSGVGRSFNLANFPVRYHSRFQLTVTATDSDIPEEASFSINDDAVEDSMTSRRRMIQTGGLSLALFLMGQPTPSFATTSTTPQTIVLTGANSGVGLEASKKLAAEGHTIVLACRTLTKAQNAIAVITEAPPSPISGKLIPAECNLASLASIKQFANDLPALLGNGDGKIDTLCLNAGIARNTAATDCARTDDGFELTVGTNHFGHFYLNHLLLPKIKPSGKIVIAASSVHDPDGPGGAQGVPATLGDLKGLEEKGRACEMIDGGAFNADKAYKDSKLCNVLFTRELQRRLENNASTKGIIANCFSPGLIVGTGLFRDQNPLFVKIFDFAATDLLRVGETPSWGGGALAFMIDSVNDSRGQFYNSEPGSSKYGNEAYGKQFAPYPVSKEAMDDAKAKKFWELTEKELGL